MNPPDKKLATGFLVLLLVLSAIVRYRFPQYGVFYRGTLVVVFIVLMLLFVASYVVYKYRRKKDHERYRRGYQKDEHCLPIPPKYWKKPDPFLYDQFFLMAQGLEVTWDNPDIWIEQGGSVIVGDLTPNTEYDVVARIWNASFEAPAFNVMVKFYQRDYGAGAVPQFIGATNIPVVQVRGLPPSETRLKWRPPPTGGHYCILVRIVCPDDANPFNNEGQKNLTVRNASAGAALDFVFPIHNPFDRPISFRLRAAMYRLPGSPAAARTDTLATRDETRVRPGNGLNDITFRPLARQAEIKALETNGYGNFPLPGEWAANFSGTVVVPSGGAESVHLHLALPAGLAAGAYPVSMYAETAEGAQPYGGVTTIITVS
jgi:heme/copper-type cytochrome/quinol oxidase subunit 2